MQEPYYWFIDKVFENQEYEGFVGVDSIFNIFSRGMTTLRDVLCVGYTKVDIANNCNYLKWRG